MERIPKNIRQIGGSEERIKVYMEDYVSTYLRRLSQKEEENGIVGFLVGNRQKEGIDTPPCVFVDGAMELRKICMDSGSIRFLPQVWEEGYESLGTYFSGQDLCGVFVCEGSCRRFRRQALFAAVREAFPEQESLLYLMTEEGEEIVYRIQPRKEERLQGYYCYFERNEAMQEYMMDHLPDRRVEWELSYRKTPEKEIYSGQVTGKDGVLGDPVDRFRQKMDRQKRRRPSRLEWGKIGPVCAVMAAVIFVSGLGLAYKERGGLQMKDLLSRLDIDPGIWAAVSAWQEETGEHYVGRESSSAKKESNAIGEGSGGIKVEEIPGNVYPTEESPEAVDGEETGAASESGEGSVTEVVTEAATETTAEVATDAVAESVTEAVAEWETENVTESLAVDADPSAEIPVGTGVIYQVKEGDSLYSISRRFYGTEEMVAVIQQMNGLKDADLIKVGQELLLP